MIQRPDTGDKAGKRWIIGAMSQVFCPKRRPGARVGIPTVLIPQCFCFIELGGFEIDLR
jgi:hypothetical protein